MIVPVWIGRGDKLSPPRPEHPLITAIFFSDWGRYTGGVSETLVINEIYRSLQGESTFAGLPCVFIRLTACDLRCSYCDTAYAFTEGKRQSFADILARVAELAAPYKNLPVSAAAGPLPLVELTGGEPLLQKNSPALMRQLCDAGHTVLLETSGAHDIAMVDPRVRRIVDLKCPASGESARNRWENLAHLQPTDEIKFVIGTREDYVWMKEQIHAHNLAARCPLLCSWVHPLTPEQQSQVLKRVPAGLTPISRRELVEQIVADALPVRFQAQLHKIIWPPEQRGV
jgi:7-carboxy-7-deazaguanine synthase